jgi:hypothetical protein
MLAIRKSMIALGTVGLLGVLGLTCLGATVHGLESKPLLKEKSEKMQAAMDSMIQRLVEGTTLHLRIEMYNRQGTAAAEIAQVPFAMPENSVLDQWYGPLGKDRLFAGVKAQITDIFGRTIQESSTVSGEVVVVDTSLGKEIEDPWQPWCPDTYLSGAANLAKRLLDQGWYSSGSGLLNGMESVSFQKLVTPERSPLVLADGKGVNIPYTLDLKTSQLLNRIEIPIDNPLLVHHQTWIVDDVGTTTLIFEEKTSLAEVEIN